MAWKKCRDLEKLVELRGNCEGARDFICLIYRQSLLHQNFSETESLQETINLAYKMKDLLAQGLSSKEIMRILNLKKPTFYRYKKQIEN